MKINLPDSHEEFVVWALEHKGSRQSVLSCLTWVYANDPNSFFSRIDMYHKLKEELSSWVKTVVEQDFPELLIVKNEPKAGMKYVYVAGVLVYTDLL